MYTWALEPRRITPFLSVFKAFCTVSGFAPANFWALAQVASTAIAHVRCWITDIATYTWGIRSDGDMLRSWTCWAHVYNFTEGRKPASSRLRTTSPLFRRNRVEISTFCKKETRTLHRRTPFFTVQNWNFLPKYRLLYKMWLRCSQYMHHKASGCANHILCVMNLQLGIKWENFSIFSGADW